MAKHDLMKKIFADTLQELAKRKPLHDIQVKELCEACQVERTTFYYHFRDKYDLIAWIFEQDCLAAEKQGFKVNSKEMVLYMCYRIKDRRAFYKSALEDHSQNNLKKYVFDFYYAYEKKYLCEKLHCDQLDEETDYAVRYYLYGSAEMRIEWLCGRSNLSIENLAYFQYKTLPDILKE